MTHAHGLCELFKEAMLPWQVPPAVPVWLREEKAHYHGDRLFVLGSLSRKGLCKEGGWRGGQRRVIDQVTKVTDVLGSMLAVDFLLPHFLEEEAEAPRA